LAGEADLAKAAHWMAVLADYMQEAGLKLAMEIHHGGLLETIDSSLALVGKIDRANVGLILDPGNMAIAGEPYGAEAVARIGSRLMHVHTKDVRFYPDRKEGFPFYKQRCFSVELMGNGHVDHRPAYRALLEANYDGYVTLEAQPRGTAPAETAAHEIRCFRAAIQDIQGG
jgi:sugar phosphate isomerase/epimerase